MSLSYLKSSMFSECKSPDNILEQRPDLCAYSNVTVLRHFPCVWVEFYALSMQVGVTQKSLRQFKWIICRNPKKNGFLSLQEKRVRTWRQQRRIFFFLSCKIARRQLDMLPLCLNRRNFTTVICFHIKYLYLLYYYEFRDLCCVDLHGRVRTREAMTKKLE